MLPVPKLSLPGWPWLLDGPTGTELERRGYATRLPLWTALAPRECPQLLLRVHQDYVDAGADVLTACTFRTSAYALDKSGLAREARALTAEAVALAQQAARSAQRPVLVAGSLAPLEDCYHPDRTPPDATIEREHAAHVRALVDAGVDLLLVETMPTLREALIAARCASVSSVPFIVSWVVDSGARTLDGTALDACLESVRAAVPALVAVNCASLDACTDAMPALARTGLPFGAYANSGTPDGTFGFAPEHLDIDLYARVAARWLAAGASMIGGCCGTTPSHIASLRSLLDGSAREATP